MKSCTHVHAPDTQSFFVCVLQEVQGWYYLLEEEVGRKKHLKVPTLHSYHATGKVTYWKSLVIRN